MEDLAIEQKTKSVKEEKTKAMKLEGAELIRDQALSTLGKRRHTDSDTKSPSKSKQFQTLLTLLQNDDSSKLKQSRS